MVDENDRRRWDEAYDKAVKTHDFIYRRPDGAPKEHKTMAEWLFDKYQQSLRWGWVRRFVLVQVPFAVATVAALYGTATAIYQGALWLLEFIK